MTNLKKFHNSKNRHLSLIIEEMLPAWALFQNYRNFVIMKVDRFFHSLLNGYWLCAATLVNEWNHFLCMKIALRFHFRIWSIKTRNFLEVQYFPLRNKAEMYLVHKKIMQLFYFKFLTIIDYIVLFFWICLRAFL